ncbi:MAG: rhomboid family intramembrane serine protease, partial [Lutibacter sp.]|nr:rhomboid family intramembrane serine protease [Lutibacter sp.]
IHSGSRHLLHNSLPLFVLLWALCYFYRQIAAKVLVRGLFFTGMLTWFFARPAYHIGASGLVYLLVSFVFFSGMIRQYYRLVALSLAVVFIYGSMVWYLFPIQASISWEGHLSGFVTGLFLAYWHRKQGPQPEVFQFSNTDDFDELFDAEGNFVPAETVEETPERE